MTRESRRSLFSSCVSTLRGLVISVITVSLTWNGFSISLATAQAPSTLVTPAFSNPEDAERALGEFLDLAQALRGVIDRRQFDLDALLEALDYDVEAILEFASREIVFEPYRGLLRGPAGTLMGRAGNALDQSVLLAKLLKDAGYDARIAEGALSADDINRLNGSARSAEYPGSPFTDPDAAGEIFKKMSDVARWSKEDSEEPVRKVTELRTNEVPRSSLHAAAGTEAARLLSLVSEAGIDLESHGDPDQLQQDSSDYYWVQYRASNSQWMDVHPAFGDQADPVIEPLSYLADEVPSALQHRVRMETQLVRFFGENSETIALLSNWENAAANLAYRAAQYTHAPLMIPEGAESPLEFLASSEIYAPVIDGAVASNHAFDIHGNTIPMDAVQSMGAELVKTMGDKARLAESALRGLGSQEGNSGARSGISAVRLLITLIAPGGRERTFERNLYSPCDDHQPVGFKGDCVINAPTLLDRLALATSTSLAIAVGRQPESYILDRMLERLIKDEPVWRLALDPDRRESIPDWVETVRADDTWLGFLPLFQTLDSSLNPAHIFRTEPTAVLFQQGLTESGEGITTLDILSNRKRALIRDEAGIGPAPQALVYEGVWETGAENYFFTGSEEEAAQRAFPLIRANSGSNNAVVIKDAAAAPEWGKRLMERPLEEGYVIIARLSAEKDEKEQISWYRVNPATGETLGMTSSGRGGFAEYLLMLLAGIFINAPVYMAMCAVAGYDTAQCVMVGSTVATFGLGGFAFAIALMRTILLWPSEAY